MIFVKRIRRQCGMRGCRNTDTYSLSRFNESAAGNIIICKDCLKAALEAVENCVMPAVDYRAKKQTAPPPLFHNAAFDEDVKEEVQANEASTEPEKETVATAKKSVARKRAAKSE